MITITQQPTDPTTATTATFQFTSAPAATTYSCTVSGSGGSTVACTPSTNVVFNGLGLGSHTFTVTPTPAGTNGTYTWTINAVPTAPPAYVNGASISCTIEVGGDCQDTGTMTIAVGTWTGTPAPTFTYEWFYNSSGSSAGACTLAAGDGWNSAGLGTSASQALPDIPVGNGTDSMGVKVTGSNADPGSPHSENFCRNFESAPPPAAVPTPGTVSLDTCGGFDCDEGETITATTGAWNDNGSAITGYYYEWYDRSDDNCSDSGSWGTVEDRDPNSGTTLSLTEQFGLPFSSGNYTVKVRVYAVNGIGPSTSFVEACAQIDG